MLDAPESRCLDTPHKSTHIPAAPRRGGATFLWSGRPVRSLVDELQAAVAERYRVEAEIGHGGAAHVFRALDLARERSVAIKVMRPELAVAPDRFLREILILARLQHPNVMPLFDSGLAGDLPYYVMPLIDGETLRDRLRAGPIPFAEALTIVLEVADALSYAHSQGLVHRDVKPENILLAGGHAIVTDFGIARAVEQSIDGSLTTTGLVVGTPAYMSPEQRAGDRILDARSDQYSLACVVHEILWQKVPPPASPTGSGAAAAAQAVIVAMRKLRPEVPESLARAVARALSYEPESRFGSVAEFAEALTGDVAHSLSGSQRVRAVLRGARAPERRTALLAAIAVALVVVGGVAFVVYRAGDAGRAPKPPDLDPRHVAVLYFDDLSADKSLEYLASGLTEGLIHELSGVGAIQVISRNGVKPYRDASPVLDSLVQKLHVGSVVEGSVQRSANRVRVTVRLTDARTRVQVASSAFERDMGELFRLEDDLAARVSDLLRRRIGAVIKLREREAATSSQSARELAYRADRLRDKAAALAATNDTADVAAALATLRTADSLLARAEAADKAWLGAAVERGWLALDAGRYAAGPQRQRALDQTIERADGVLRRDSLNASALELRGTARYLIAARLASSDTLVRAQFGQAIADLQKAVQIDSSRASAWGTMSHARVAVGDIAGAERDAHVALDMDAYLDDRANIFMRLYAAELMADSLGASWRWCRDGAAEFVRDQRFMECQLTLLAEDPAAKPDPRRAWALVSAADKADPPEHARAQGRAWLPIYRRMMAAIVLARAGLADSARAVADRAERDVGSDSELATDMLYEQALLHLTLGDRDQAIAELTRYLAARPTLRRLVGTHPRWRRLRDDRRFQNLVASG